MPTYKSKELIEKEQAIIEKALNDLVNTPDQTVESVKAADKKLKKMLDELRLKRGGDTYR